MARNAHTWALGTAACIAATQQERERATQQERETIRAELVAEIDMARTRAATRSKARKRLACAAQRDTFKDTRITTSDIQSMCSVTYLRARDLRAGKLVIRQAELNCLPGYVVDKLVAVLPYGATKARRTPTVMDPRHGEAAQEKLSW